MKKLHITIEAPAGIFKIIDKIIPMITESTAKTAEINIVALKDSFNCKAVTAGKIKSEETSITPTTLTAKTQVIAVRTTNKELMRSVLMPVVLAYSSLNVIENRS